MPVLSLSPTMRAALAAVIAALTLVLVGHPAEARTHVSVGLAFIAPMYPPAAYYPPPPVYYAPPPVYYAPPPVYYAPPPSVYYAPPPVYVVPQQPAYRTVPQPQRQTQRTCRTWRGDATIDANGDPFYGTACLESDGLWHIVARD